MAKKTKRIEQSPPSQLDVMIGKRAIDTTAPNRFIATA